MAPVIHGEGDLKEACLVVRTLQGTNNEVIRKAQCRYRLSCEGRILYNGKSDVSVPGNGAQHHHFHNFMGTAVDSCYQLQRSRSGYILGKCQIPSKLLVLI